MTYLFFKSPGHVVHFALCALLCLLFFVTNLLVVYYFVRRYAGDIYTAVSHVLVNASVYALILSIPVMPFVFGIQGFAGPMLNLFVFSYFVWQTVHTAIQAKVSWPKLVIPFSLSSLCAWLVMALANYWIFGLVATRLWAQFKVV